MGPVSDLERGRRSFTDAAWQEAYEALSEADRVAPLGAADLELLARAAYMLGRDEDYVATLERAYRGHLATGATAQAVRAAFWVGHSWLFRGQGSPAAGWFARAGRLLEGVSDEGAEHGYVLIAEMLACSAKGDVEGALAAATRIAAIGDRFGDHDLLAVGLMEQGHALVRLGRAEEGARLIDETMVSVTSGELSPIVAGIVYCNTIAFCRAVYQLRRVREWTDALTRWCERQPDMVAHKGVCLVHRAEIMTLCGEWDGALEELHRLDGGLRQGALNQLAAGEAAYREGEVHRLRGEFAAADRCYRSASAFGREAEPGLARLRLAQGHVDSAAATIRRAVAETPRGLPRVALLPAFVEIMLAAGDLDAARAASAELAEVATQQGSEAIDALSWQARGQVALATGDGAGALVPLRRAWRAWQQLGAPYEAARTRTLLGRACRLVGDEDTASLDLEAAAESFTQLGAKPDLVELRSLLADADRTDEHGLTRRELEVLRLVATGLSNRAISASLVVSEHTVARHLQNIFAKIGVTSRTAASAYAFEHGLV